MSAANVECFRASRAPALASRNLNCHRAGIAAAHFFGRDGVLGRWDPAFPLSSPMKLIRSSWMIGLVAGRQGPSPVLRSVSCAFLQFLLVGSSD